jgi:hypothetical protein
MARQKPDSVATKEILGHSIMGALIAHGTATTSGTPNAVAAQNHGATDKDGKALPTANLRCIAFPTGGGGFLYQFTSVSATQIDIRSATASIPYIWFLYVVN